MRRGYRFAGLISGVVAASLLIASCGGNDQKTLPSTKNKSLTTGTLVAPRLSFKNFSAANGLADDFVWAVSAMGTTLYVATDNGLSFTTNGGTSFTNVTTANGLPNNRVYDVSSSSIKVYVATSGGLAYRSQNFSWVTRTSANGLGQNYVYEVLEVGNDQVYAATDNGLSVSKAPFTSFSSATPKSFTNYNMMTAGFGATRVTGIAVDGCNWYAATDGGTTDFRGGLSISRDCGKSWSTRTIANGLGHKDLNGVFVVGSTIYAATKAGLSISTDGGTTFTSRTSAQGLSGNSVRKVFVEGLTVYAATDNGLSISKDGGATFTTYTTDDGLGGNRIQNVSVIGSKVYVATNGGVSISQ